MTSDPAGSFEDPRTKLRSSRLDVPNVPARIFSLLLTVCCAACSGGGSGATQPTLKSIQISPASANILPGQNLQFQATGTYSDGSTDDITMQASWVSSQTSAVNIGASGQASALATGSTVIRAQLAGVMATATLSVAPSTWHVARYEAEAGMLSGAAAVVGAADGSDRAVGDLGGEASGRRAVTLIGAGDSVAWTVAASEASANAVVLRFSIPDAPGGGGLSGSLDLAIANKNGASRFADSLQLTSRYSWLYGGVMDGTKLYDVPANATTYATAATPTHLYDEIQLKLPIVLAAGDTITLSRNMAAAFGVIAVDFVELETVPAALTPASGYLSLTDPRCGAIALDLRNSNSVFDGADDSSYGSVFNAVIGINPYNPASFSVQEKVTYSTNPASDALQDTVASAASAGMSMFALADHNLHSLQTCLALAAASGSGLAGVFVPPGRYYVRGVLPVPSNIALQGAGMWYSKFTAVDTEAPSAVTVNGRTGIAGLSGNLVISSPTGGSTGVRLSNFAIFGNVTQRDV
ncbi:MAG: Ig-like domain-containing protein, partial [Burkholderiaceae bacterium]|nr:Ig-like domain-containing protein [Burkholderiaceae bacterium]